MKNKKLFAILTLVCFMFTLMPVAAFAADPTYYLAEVSGDKTVTAGKDNVALTIKTDDTATTISTYVFAYKDGEYFSKTGLKAVDFVYDATTRVHKANFSIQIAGDYEVYVVDNNDDAKKIMAKADTMLNAEVAAKLLADATKVSMENNKVTVLGSKVKYDVELSHLKGAVKADNGYSTAIYSVTVTSGEGENKRPVANADVDVYTGSYGLKAVKLAAKTNVAGELKVQVSGTIAGDFYLYASYGDDTDSVKVNVGSVGVDTVEVLAEPVAPINNETSTAFMSGIRFQFKDANGAVVPMEDCKVALVAAPAGVDKSVELKLAVAKDAKGNTIDGYAVQRAKGADTAFTIPVNGTYTFKVSLQNGASATASVTVADFDKTVAIKFVNAPTTVAYNKDGVKVTGDYIIALDKNGVSKKIDSAKVSVNGKAVDKFVPETGVLTIFDKEELIGSNITVFAVYEEAGKSFTTSNELTVVEGAATIDYAATNAEVGKNSVLFGNIVTVDGKAAPFDKANIATDGIKVIVLEKPATAVVSAVPQASLNDKDQVVLNFLASEAGEYKVQTIITTKDGKYISGIETITVGAGEGTFKDVIVMSIGAKQLVKNAEVVAMPAAPEIVDSRTMVPARAGLEAFGAVVVWDEAARTVTAELNGVKVVMTIGEKAYTVNGKAMVGDAAPYITEASTMVPVSFFTNAFGIVATPIYDANGVCDVLFTK